jgi:hypothetical protein
VPPADTAPAPGPTTTVTDVDLDYLAARNLLIPVANATASQLHDTFNQARSEGRRHDAIDILSPERTAIAVKGEAPRLVIGENGYRG